MWEALNALWSIRSVKHYLLLLFFFKVGQAVLAFQALIPVQLQALVSMATAESVRHGCALGPVQAAGTEQEQ